MIKYFRFFTYIEDKKFHILFLLSLIWIKEINYLFYDINQSPDINKYIIYLEHFYNNIPTNREHGLLYYYLQTLHLNFFFSKQEHHRGLLFEKHMGFLVLWLD